MRYDDDEDVTEYGSKGHLDWCKECGRQDALDGERPDSCDFKNWDECNAWHDGYAEGRQERAAPAEPTDAPREN